MTINVQISLRVSDGLVLREDTKPDLFQIVIICVKLTGGGAERVCVDVANGLAAEKRFNYT